MTMNHVPVRALRQIPNTENIYKNYVKLVNDQKGGVDIVFTLTRINLYNPITHIYRPIVIGNIYQWKVTFVVNKKDVQEFYINATHDEVEKFSNVLGRVM